MKEVYEANYGYYSNLLNKNFRTIDELINAEKEKIEERNAKAEKSEVKKSDAKKVEDAFKALNSAKKQYEEEILQAEKACAKIIADAKAAWAKSVEASKSKLAKADENYHNALKDFTAKYPEGYHMTFRDGDTVTNITHTSYDSMLQDFYKTFLKLFD